MLFGYREGKSCCLEFSGRKTHAPSPILSVFVYWMNCFGTEVPCPSYATWLGCGFWENWRLEVHADNMSMSHPAPGIVIYAIRKRPTCPYHVRIEGIVSIESHKMPGFMFISAMSHWRTQCPCLVEEGLKCCCSYIWVRWVAAIRKDVLEA